MARGKTLGDLLNDLRFETRVSQNPAHNVGARDTQVQMLQRIQEWLWESYNWGHMRVDRYYPTQAGQRYYDFSADFDLERINTISFRDGGVWAPIYEGIEADNYLSWDSDLDQRTWPVRRWKLHEGNQIEFWPLVDRNSDAVTLEGQLKVNGIKRLAKFVDDADVADLDNRLIVLYAASEMLGGRGSKDANIKLSLANAHLATLRGRLTKRTNFRMFGVGGAVEPRRPVITNYQPPYPTSV